MCVISRANFLLSVKTPKEGDEEMYPEESMLEPTCNGVKGVEIMTHGRNQALGWRAGAEQAERLSNELGMERGDTEAK